MRKRLERTGRSFLVWLMGLCFGVRQRAVELKEAPTILVVRLDERIGNLLLLVPLLDSLRKTFPRARIELLGSIKGRALLKNHPAIDAFLPFRKKALFAPDGPLRTPSQLRRRHYDLAIDAANPTDPSTTQSILVRLCGARHTIGPDYPGFARLFTARAPIPDDPSTHEIDLRLALLRPIEGVKLSRRVYLGELPPLKRTSPVPELISQLERFAVINVGARLRDKMITKEDYAALARAVANAGLTPLVTYGPGEELLAELVIDIQPAKLAPPTDLIELATILRAARAVVTCDTGPMHLGVAVETPTCGLFVSTDPDRFGYNTPHAAIDIRGRASSAWMQDVEQWLQTRMSTIDDTSTPKSHTKLPDERGT